MSALVRTLELARDGKVSAEIAAELNVPVDLAEAMVQHWVRLGEIGELRSAASCGERSIACSGCFFADICTDPQ